MFRNEVGIDIKYDESTLSNYKVIHPSNFVISLRSFQGGFELSDKLGITSPAYTIFVPIYAEQHSSIYWATLFKTFKFIESLKTVTFGIRDGKSISFKEFGDVKLQYPNYKNEQKSIGDFFNALNNLIAVNQRLNQQCLIILLKYIYAVKKPSELTDDLHLLFICIIFCYLYNVLDYYKLQNNKL